MIRVAHILFSSELGGAEQVAINISRNLNDCYHFTYFSPSGPIQNSVMAERIEYQSFDPKQIIKLKREIEATKPDIIHAHDFKASFLANFLFRHIPIVTHIHQSPLWQTTCNLKSIAFKHVADKSARVIYVSKWAKESYIFQDKLTNTTVIPNGVDIERIKELAYLSIPTAFDLLFVGRLEEVKNPERFVEISKRLLVMFPNLKIGIVGDGSLKERLQSLIRELPQISLLGFQSNPYQYMARAKVVLSTSKSDAFGLTMVEAALLGAIPIAPSIGGIAQTTDELNGIVYASDDALLASLRDIFSDALIYKQFKSEISKIDFTKYGQMRFVNQIRQVYEGVLNDD